MRKLWFFFLAAAVLLSACSQGSGGQVSVTATTAPVPTVNPNAPKMECKVESSLVATPDVDMLAKFPPKIEGDWTKGSDQASLKIIEYSDYM